MQFTRGRVQELKNAHNSVTIQNRTHVYMNFFDHRPRKSPPSVMSTSHETPCIYVYIQGVSRLDITAGSDFLGLCDQKSSCKHVSDFGRLRSYGNFLIPVHAPV